MRLVELFESTYDTEWHSLLTDYLVHDKENQVLSLSVDTLVKMLSQHGYDIPKSFVIEFLNTTDEFKVENDMINLNDKEIPIGKSQEEKSKNQVSKLASQTIDKDKKDK